MGVGGGRGAVGQIEIFSHCKHDSSEKECVGKIKNGDHKQVNIESFFFACTGTFKLLCFNWLINSIQ